MTPDTKCNIGTAVVGLKNGNSDEINNNILVVSAIFYWTIEAVANRFVRYTNSTNYKWFD